MEGAPLMAFIGGYTTRDDLGSLVDSMFIEITEGTKFQRS
jgi:hypothetical protein